MNRTREMIKVARKLEFKMLLKHANLGDQWKAEVASADKSALDGLLRKRKEQLRLQKDRLKPGLYDMLLQEANRIIENAKQSVPAPAAPAAAAPAAAAPAPAAPAPAAPAGPASITHKFNLPAKYTSTFMSDPAKANTITRALNTLYSMSPNASSSEIEAAIKAAVGEPTQDNTKEPIEEYTGPVLRQG